MAARKKLTIHYPEGQKYSCRDCPARCCTSSWGIPVSKEEYERITADEEACDRLTERGRAILKAGILPMREKNEKLACVFLDDDLLCSLHKRRGHSFIPAACQAYPFGFSENEKKEPVALLSRYCPSIRDNYGEPVAEVISQKFKEAGGAHQMIDRMGLRSGRALPRVQYVRVIESWIEILKSTSDVATALTEMFAFTERIDLGLPKTHAPDDRAFSEIVTASLPTELQPVKARGLTFNGRILLSHLLGGICYPSRVMLAHRLAPVTFWEKVRSWGNRLSWLFELGSVKLLFVEKPVPVARIKKIHGVLRDKQSVLVRDYMVELLERRQGLTRKSYLHRLIVDMALMATLVSRYARAAAAADGSPEVSEAGVREGIGIAELLFSHQGDSGQSLVLHQLRLKLMSSPEDFQAMLAAEV